MTIHQDLIGHQAVRSWQGVDVLTLAPLWPSGRPYAVIVGINPAPRSVEAGHYYQGAMGRYAMKVLREVGVLATDPAYEFDDDAALAQGIAFTDLVPRPTRKANEVRAAERAEGVERLREEIRQHRPRMILAVFKPPVVALLDKAHGKPGRAK